MTQAADEFRPDIPSTARIYDYYLGGKDNYPADRAAAEHIIASMPNGVVRTAAVQNRKFLMRAVRHLTADLGIRQFLDIGTGLPTMNSVHQVAQSVAPDSRVVYVDHDPIVLAHSRNLLHGNERATVIRQDLRDPAGILADPQLRADARLPPAGRGAAGGRPALRRPTRKTPTASVKALMDPMPAGSYLVISHFTADSFDEQADAAAQGYKNATSSVHHRTRAEIAEFFAGYDLIDPGELVWAPRWRRDADAPDDDPEVAANPGRSLSWCGVGRKSRSSAGRKRLPATAVSLGQDGAPALSGPRVTSLGIAGGRSTRTPPRQARSCTPMSRTSRGCTTTCSAARTTTRRTGRRRSGPSRCSARTWCAAPCCRTGSSSAAPSGTWPPSGASGSSSTSAPACPR